MGLALRTPLYGAEDEQGRKRTLPKGIELLQENRALLQKIIDTYYARDKGEKHEAWGKEEYAKKVIGRVFEHSIQDGLYLAETLQLSAGVLIGVISRPEFIVKHKKFSQGVAEKVRQEYHRYGYNPDYQAPLPLRVLYKIFERFSDEKKIFKGHYYRSLASPDFLDLRKYKAISWKEVENASPSGFPDTRINPNDSEVREIDQHYSDFLQVRRFDSGEDIGQAIEERAENHLRTVELVYQGVYYAGEIKALFLSQVPDEFTQRRINIAFAKLPHQDLLTLNEIEEVASKLRIELDPIRKKIERSKYILTKEVYFTERALLVDLLLEELQRILAIRLGNDVTLVQDEDSGEYRIVNPLDIDQTFNAQEEALLELLNCLENPTVENIHTYFQNKKDRKMLHEKIFQNAFGRSSADY